MGWSKGGKVKKGAKDRTKQAHPKSSKQMIARRGRPEGQGKKAREEARGRLSDSGVVQVHGPAGCNKMVAEDCKKHKAKTKGFKKCRKDAKYKKIEDMTEKQKAE